MNLFGKRALFSVTVDGKELGGTLAPILTSISVEDQAGTHGDTATIELSDEGGQIVLPKTGAAIKIALGWLGAGTREVFSGKVDEVRSSGDRSGGMKLTICAKGFDAKGKAKEGKERHWDGKTVGEIITAAAKDAGVSVDVDPALKIVTIPYIAQQAESLLHFGQRLAGMVGASFRVQGDKAVMAKRAGDYSPAITAERGVNLHSWDITPLIGRNAHGTTEAQYFDRAKGKIEKVTASTGIEADACLCSRTIHPDKEAAQRQCDADAAKVKEKSGGGTVTIEGAPDAMPDGKCTLKGARPGIDGEYRIKSVSHNLTRSGGYTTTLELAHPQGDAGTDKRAKPKAGSSTSTTGSAGSTYTEAPPGSGEGAR